MGFWNGSELHFYVSAVCFEEPEKSSVRIFLVFSVSFEGRLDACVVVIETFTGENKMEK